MTRLPIDEMVRDACRLESAIEGYCGQHMSKARDVCCHVKAMADEIVRLRGALAQIALDQSRDHPQSIAFCALGQPPMHAMWEMVNAARRDEMESEVGDE